MLNILTIFVLISGTIFNYIEIVWGQSPCPNTFQYQSDNNNNIYGLISVSSYDELQLNLEVDLSIGNAIGEFNGQIEMLTPRSTAVENLKKRKPIMYKVVFPVWERVPPYVMRVAVNGGIVCSGPPITGDWLRYITNVTLKHMLSIQEEIRGQNLLPSTNLLQPNLLPPSSSLKPNLGEVHFYNFDFTQFLRPQQVEPTREPSVVIDSYPYQINSGTTNPFFNGEYYYSSQLPPRLPNNNKNFYYYDSNYNNRPGPFVYQQTTNNRPFYNQNQFTPKPTPQPLPDPTVRAPQYTPRPPVASKDNTCGVPEGINTLIVKGKEVNPGDYPWLTAIFLRSRYICAGTLISHQHIITAAHCLYSDGLKIVPSNLLFVLGRTDIELLDTRDGAYSVRGEKFFIHTEYQPQQSDADIAVVVIAQTVPFTQFIKPICLWTEPNDLNLIVGHIGIVAGWGINEGGTNDLSAAREVELPVVSQKECRKSDGVYESIISNRTFCAGQRNGRGPCNGDSGSGFIMWRNSKYFLRGIVSLSKENLVSNLRCDLSHFVVYTDVSKHMDWLLDKLK